MGDLRAREPARVRQEPLSLDEARLVLRHFDFEQTVDLFGTALTKELRELAVRTLLESSDEEIYTRSAAGALFCVRPKKDSITSRFILAEGLYEPATSAFLKHVLRPNDVYVDVGANLGAHAIHAGLYVGPGGTVVAFEPNPAVARDLRTNAALNGLKNLVLHQLAVAEEEGSGTLVVNPVHLGTAVLTRSPDEADTLASNFEAGVKADPQAQMIPLPGIEYDLSSFGDLHADRYDVRVEPLAKLLTCDQARRARVLKVDVEGYEMSVLRSAEFLLAQRSPPFVTVEYEERYAGARAELFDFFAGRGWHCFIVSASPFGKPTFNRLREPYVASQFENLYAASPDNVEEMIAGCELFEYPHDQMRKQFGRAERPDLYPGS